MKKDNTLNASVSYPLILIWVKHSPVSFWTQVSQSMAKNILANKNRNNPMYGSTQSPEISLSKQARTITIFKDLEKM